jgi:cytochrome c
VVTLTLTAAVALSFGIAGSAGESGPSAALYTDAQANQGVDPYENKCAMCHGANMEGETGPTLVGPTFTSHYETIGDLMQFIVQNMPMDDPGSLPHDDYAAILAYVLLKNGFPSGAHPLTFDGANGSKVPLAQAAP